MCFSNSEALASIAAHFHADLVAIIVIEAAVEGCCSGQVTHGYSCSASTANSWDSARPSCR